MNRSRRRTWSVMSLAACGLAATVALTGCSSGQISQMATQEPAVNGTLAEVGDIALRNIHLQAEQSGDFIEPGTDVQLIFVAATENPLTEDKLVSITSEVGTVTLTGDTTLPRGGMLVVGTPAGQAEALEDIEAAEVAEAEVTLSEPIANGLLYDFTFTFEKAGETTVSVPVSAGDAPRRN
ncbi:LpqE protein [Mycolicibacterium thermoresistibile]|nr:LpqE protein [Mycolicibacterium thermoresistibile]